MTTPIPQGHETHELLLQIEQGDAQALEDLLQKHRPLVRQMVELRMDPKMKGRVDPSDVVQEAQIEVMNRIQDYLERRPMPFQLWLRQTAYQNLLRLRRKHVEADCRAVDREQGLPDHSSIMLAQQIMGNQPDQKMVEAELIERVQAAMESLDETDREILLMRHFEQMSNQEVAQVLEMEPGTASKRYGRAILKLRGKLITPEMGESEL